VSDVDVEREIPRECLANLEEEMFERSKAVGIAGEYQWGLDTGDHQDSWNSYDSLPSEWVYADSERLENDDDDERVSNSLQAEDLNYNEITSSQLQPGPKFVKITKPTVNSDLKPQPNLLKPRMSESSKKNEKKLTRSLRLGVCRSNNY
jgi:hypothetical protein